MINNVFSSILTLCCFTFSCFFDRLEFDPRPFDLKLFDPKSFDPIAVNRTDRFVQKLMNVVRVQIML